MSCDFCTGVLFQDSVGITKVALKACDKLLTSFLIGFSNMLFQHNQEIARKLPDLLLVGIHEGLGMRLRVGGARVRVQAGVANHASSLPVTLFSGSPPQCTHMTSIHKRIEN